MSPFLTHASRQDGHLLASGHVPGETRIRERMIRRRLRTLDRRFSRFLKECREDPTAEGFASLSRGGRDWLLENDFIVAEALQTLDGAITSEFLSRLPGLSDPSDELKVRPRIEVIAGELVCRDRGRLDTDEIALFVEGYQEVHSLRLAELWALPAFLRLILLEELLEGLTGGGKSFEVGPYILSLRTLANQDWRDVVEALSGVEQILRQDPCGVYTRMDFRTRDRYRNEVERISRAAGAGEERVARMALEEARSRAARPREGHVGYYLVDEGRAALFRALGRRVPVGGTPRRRRRWAGVLYFGGISVLSVLLVLFFAALAGGGSLSGLTPSSLIPVLLALVPAVGVAVALANRVAGQFSLPRSLPRLDMREGVPDEFRTVVSVPVLLTSRADVREFLQTIESNHRANPDPNLTWALLSDFPDSDSEHTEEDRELLAVASRGVRQLNRRYGQGGRTPFLLLHRGRRWNPVERRWMGWERKRGKLVELSHLLLGGPSSLWAAEGDAERLENTPFVLTLDSDTRLPQDAASRLVGTLAHPLNRPEVGEEGRILRGYSVLQPRLEPLPEPDGGTIFSRIYGGVQGLDLYSRAAFDVYQDLFDVGIFAGKGIFDVRAFEASLAGRTPDNAILSHDLFEGAHGRAGLVSDLTLLEEFPGHPLTHSRRAHRWIRGDWQLLPWLFPRVLGAAGVRLENRIPLLGRWMILDNLRRSLQPPTVLFSFLAGWALLAPPAAAFWTVLLALVVGLPSLMAAVDALLRTLRALPARADVGVEARALGRAVARWGMELSFLPFEAWTSADAILRTLYRVVVSRERLLEWTSSALMARQVRRRDSLGSLLRGMWPGPAVALVGAAGLLLLPISFPVAATPLLALWLASPLVGHWARRSHRPIRDPRGVFPREAARTLARRTWGYYEAFQGPEGNWMAPDHFQESPGREVARRTSPTNLGMGLVAVATAWDLGFVDTGRFVARVRANLDGMHRLPRYRGHFYNWYDTVDCKPLAPLYISTVDSGNLAAAFLAAREALLDARSRPLWTRDQVEGVLDTVRVVGETVEEAGGTGTARALLAEVHELEAWVRSHLFQAWDGGLPGFVESLEELRHGRIETLEQAFLRVQGPASEAEDVERWDAIHVWMSHLKAHVERLLDELLLFLPWLDPEIREGSAAAALNARVLPPGSGIPSLRRLASLLARELPKEAEGGEGHPEDPLERGLREALQALQILTGDLSDLVSELEVWYREMDFTFLYDDQRELFRIGFSVTEGTLDQNHYDLLASEARLASAITMSVGDAPPTHWLHLGRPFKWTRRGTVLLSWAGTMFEYLMPLIFMRCPPESVLEDACRRAVAVQRDHGKKLGIPWGVSESGYHVLSPEGHYQYRAFGVPLLGLRRTGGNRQVVAPYASLMAISLAPGAAFRNLEAMRALGGMGPWGPYEALDFGIDAQWRDKPRVVRSYMSHHHGMLLAALGNHLTENLLVERFHRDPGIRAIEPYLFERIPWRRPVERAWVDRSAPVKLGGWGPGIRRWSPPLDRLPPPSHHLASRKLVVAMGSDGRGGSRWGDWSIIRGWVGDGAPAGSPHLVLLDRETNESWSPLPDGRSPVSEEPRMILEAHRAEFVRKTKGIRARMDVFLPPDGGSEVRQLLLANESPRPRRLRLAVSADIALAPVHGDLRHPAFHKLFVRAEALPDGEGILYQRRGQESLGASPVLLATVQGSDGSTPPLRWGTSREAYLGRKGSPDRPAALDAPDRLDCPGTPHHPLDPVAAGVLDLELGPWEDVNLTFLFVVGEDRQTVLQRAADLRSPNRREWALVQARARAEGELLRLNAEVDDPVVWEELLAHVLHPPGIGAVSPQVDLRQSSLWRWGISGDIPFILLEGAAGEGEAGGSGILGPLVRAQRWWARRGQEVDLVIVDQAAGEYQDQLKHRIRDRLADAGAEDLLGHRGGVHVVRGEDVGTEERTRLGALAALRLRTWGPSLERQLRDVAPRHPGVRGTGPEPAPVRPPAPGGARSEASPELGRFHGETGEFVVDLGAGETTPAPWSNIVSRDDIGFLVTESGGSFTWIGDAGEFRLTPWHNDPVLGLRGEVLYLRDEESRETWTPTPGPLGREREHQVRHGWGRTRMNASSDELDEEVSWSLHPTRPVKVVRVRLRNRGEVPRRISLTFLADWVLGSHPLHSRGRLQVGFDSDLSAVLARNRYSLAFSNRLAFLAADSAADGMATDRREFLGPDGDPMVRMPAGMLRSRPGERQVPEGAACGVICRQLVLEPGEASGVTFFLGAVADGQGTSGKAELEALLQELRSEESGVGPEEEPAEKTSREWSDYLGRVRVRTPDPELDQVMNGWLPYQTITSRLRGRTGFYQSGGAFGFRDQLQDVYTLLPLDPTLAEAHLEAAAQRQFLAGDVLHWWHPGTTRGVRTRCSDDLLWLPWVLASTVNWTGDPSLLDREVPYLDGEPLPPGTHERYDAFPVSDETGTLWDHALRAVERTAGLLSERGLPLIGTMDWNDGMDRVGHEGRGESIWLGWFFIDVCRLLVPLARARSQEDRARRLEGWSQVVLDGIEGHGWDGEWYRRAFFDDGTPLGSRDSTEARIDSIAQSWGVISGAADPQRARTALDSAWRELVRKDEGIALLLTPPFTGAGPDPGYIAAYPPGVRENGGQYTHAATWLLRAVARAGDGDRAGELLHMLLPNRRPPGSEEARRYAVEPYVVAADVYGTVPWVGRGGWTWYTGAAGWLWRVALEDVLGVSRAGTVLRVDPCIPAAWDGFEVRVRMADRQVELRVRNPDGVNRGVVSCRVDGVETDPSAIPLAGSGALAVEVTLG
ncbi:MAG: hypothetical protein EA352_06265 [Gemmatimonadales bacterium]|nr:MAG: hypothetical protein EA352_06265 [Gemmatimonadales bacterium]